MTADAFSLQLLKTPLSALPTKHVKEELKQSATSSSDGLVRASLQLIMQMIALAIATELF